MDVNSRIVCITDMFDDQTNFDKCVEELTELSLAIQHYQQGKIGIGDLASELADVDIVCTKIVHMLDIKDEVSNIKEMKIKRVEDKFGETC